MHVLLICVLLHFVSSELLNTWGKFKRPKRPESTLMRLELKGKWILDFDLAGDQEHNRNRCMSKKETVC